jgi:hypothetical protein
VILRTLARDDLAARHPASDFILGLMLYRWPVRKAACRRWLIFPGPTIPGPGVRCVSVAECIETVGAAD